MRPVSVSRDGYYVVLDRKGQISRAWRPNLANAMMYAQTLSRTVGPEGKVHVEDARTRERRWPSEP